MQKTRNLGFIIVPIIWAILNVSGANLAQAETQISSQVYAHAEGQFESTGSCTGALDVSPDYVASVTGQNKVMVMGRSPLSFESLALAKVVDVKFQSESLYILTTTDFLRWDFLTGKITSGHSNLVKIGGEFTSFVITGKSALIGAGRAGVWSFDLSKEADNSRAVTPLVQMPGNSDVRDMTLLPDGSKLVLAIDNGTDPDSFKGLMIVDLFNPVKIKKVKIDSEYPLSVRISGKYLYESFVNGIWQMDLQSILEKGKVHVYRRALSFTPFEFPTLIGKMQVDDNHFYTCVKSKPEIYSSLEIGLLN